MSAVSSPAVASPAGGAKRPSIWSRLYRGETAFNFIGRRRIWFAVSAVVILVGLASLATRGLNFGIDFKGGTSWQVPTANVSVTQARSAVGSLGIAEATVETLGNGSNRTVEVQADLSGTGSATHQAQLEQQVSAKLASLAHVVPSEVSLNDVGPTWGSNITNKALEALVAFFLGITLYITLRFEWKMAVAALVAVVHDILVTIGVYSLSGFQVTPATVVAFLTILGYSLYDTIVVFDRVQENTRGGIGTSGRLTYSDTVNLSMNQVLMRSVNTSLVAILPILSVLVIGAEILGATTLREFGLALFIGLTTGAYSSIFVASPLLAILKEREPRYVAMRQRLETKGVGATLLTPAAAAVATAATGGDRATAGSAGAGAGPAAGGAKPQSGPKPKQAARPIAGQRDRPARRPKPAPAHRAAPAELAVGDGSSGPGEAVLLRPGGAAQSGQPGRDVTSRDADPASTTVAPTAPAPAEQGQSGNGQVASSPGGTSPGGTSPGGTSPGGTSPGGTPPRPPTAQVRRPPPRPRKKGKRRH